MVETRRLNELVRSAMERLEIPQGPVTIALSGGADSAALAYLVARTRGEATALHIHHGLDASASLAAAARKVAGSLDLELEIEHVELGEGPSPELKAREARYRVFDNWPRPVLTAHTRDDNTETVLLNLVRGTGVDGLRGIPRHRPPTTWRPLLEVTRSETRELATLAGLEFLDDPMNDDTALTRNRLRLQVLPLLREINPQVDEAIARTGAILDAEGAYLDQAAPSLTNPVPVAVLLTLPRPLADRVLRSLLAGAGVGVTADRLERVWAVIAGASEREDLAGGRSVVRRGPMLELI